MNLILSTGFNFNTECDTLMKKNLMIIIVTIVMLLNFSCAVNLSQDVDKLDVYETLIPFDWKTSTPEEQGLDSELLSHAFKKIGKKPGYYSFLIIRNGYLVAEEYYNRGSKYVMDPVFSVTKSYISAVIGIAIDKGYIESIDSKLLDFFPEYIDEDTDPRKFEITIGHLLTMTAGFDHENNIGSELNKTENMIASIIASDLRFNPKTDFLYSTHGAHLLSGIINKVTGMSTREFTLRELFNPMGCESVKWIKDQNGIDFGGAGMFLTPRDMARFGYLYLKNGILDGKQIVPINWIKQSVTNHRHYLKSWNEMYDVGYGYLWWTGTLNEYPLYFASGYGGQWILIIPDLDMVIVSTMNALTELHGKQMEFFITIVNNYILPAVNKQ